MFILIICIYCTQSKRLSDFYINENDFILFLRFIEKKKE